MDERAMCCGPHKEHNPDDNYAKASRVANCF
jgi:hypothetical protein